MPLGPAILLLSALSGAPGALEQRLQELPPAAAQLLRSARGRAEAAQVPVEVVEGKLLEGLAKGVPAERIVLAADDLTRRLGLAREAFTAAGLQPTRQDLERVAAACQASDPADVVRLAREAKGAPADSVVAAVRQLASLRVEGVEAEAAVPVLAALARSAPASEVARVGPLLHEYVQEGGTDRQAFLAELRARGEKRQRLDHALDPFGAGPDPLATEPASRTKERGKAHAPGLEKQDRSGSAPGLDKDSAGRKSQRCLHDKNGKPDCD